MTLLLHPGYDPVQSFAARGLSLVPGRAEHGGRVHLFHLVSVLLHSGRDVRFFGNNDPVARSDPRPVHMKRLGLARALQAIQGLGAGAVLLVEHRQLFGPRRERPRPWRIRQHPDSALEQVALAAMRAGATVIVTSRLERAHKRANSPESLPGWMASAADTVLLAEHLPAPRELA